MLLKFISTKLSFPRFCKGYSQALLLSLWNIFSRQRSVSRSVMALVIVIFCILTGVSCAFYWSYTVYSFIHHGQNFWTVTMAFDSRSDMAVLVRVGIGIVGYSTSYS
ncbi:hypothetical protein IW261DRAFT_1498014 [Armillaria novae-zelandiae]|uniref:Uncharacterized protein n=1 Tax=Armillaria novae-zelandiae TaxID=153914 RepID=A0AA39P081_9AGAR|nr:hypothetical protein IW261DRAFT_1498014 [Armillaria novae-zelandiae]